MAAVTRRQAWLEARRLAGTGASFAAITHSDGRRIVVMLDGFILELALDRHEPFALMDATQARIDGRPWSRAEFEARNNEEKRT